MCGILAALGRADASAIYQAPDGRAFIAFERLSIVDPSDSGIQPFQIKTPEGNITWALNSEIYNHEEIRAGKLAGVNNPSIRFIYCWVLVEKYGESNELWNSLDGIFACVIWDERDGSFVAAKMRLGFAVCTGARGPMVHMVCQ
eukprot:jgi/Picre1/30360/NNA_005724.t1